MKVQSSLPFLLFLLILSGCASTSDYVRGKPTWESKHLTESMFELLGMAGEYISRFDYWTGEPRPNFVESFYPNEARLADYFESLLEKHALSSWGRKNWSKDVGPQGHIDFYSRDWAERINTFYTKRGEKTFTLDPRIFKSASYFEMLSFLRGAYTRYGSNEGSSSITMANASYKVETIAMVLKDVGCSDITIYTLNSIPSPYTVYFNPTSTVAEHLNIKEIVLEPGPEQDERVVWTIYKKVD